MTDAPNFKKGVGRLATDRFDFQDHIDGTDFRHKATSINVSAPLDGYGLTNVQESLVYLVAHLSVPIIPPAKTSAQGIIRLGGDLNGTGTTADIPIVSGLQGYPVSNTNPGSIAPGTGAVLTWNGSTWIPQAISGAFTFGGDVTGTAAATTVVKINGKPVASTAPNNNDVLTWDSAIPNWKPAPISGTTLNYAGGGTWADGTTNPATTVSGQLTKIVADLAATTGDVKIGSPLRTASPTSLSAGSVGSQIAALLAALNTFQNQKGAASGLATLDGTSKVSTAQLNLGVANGIATLDGSSKITGTQLSTGVANGLATLDGTAKVTSTQLNTAVANGLATLDGSTKLTTAQRAGWYVTDALFTNDVYGSILTTYSTNSFVDDGYLTLSLATLNSDVIIIHVSAGVGASAAGGGEFKVVANSNGGGFSDVPGTFMQSFNTGANNPANVEDRWSSVSKYTVTADGTAIIKVRGRTITGAGNSFTKGSASLYCVVYRP